MSEDNVVEITQAKKPPTPLDTIAPTGPTYLVPQYLADTTGLFIEPGQVIISLCSRFFPHDDCNLEPRPKVVATVRLPMHGAKQLFEEGLKQLQRLDEHLAAEGRKAQQVVAEAKLQTDLQRNQHEHQSQKDARAIIEGRP